MGPMPRVQAIAGRLRSLIRRVGFFRLSILVIIVLVLADAIAGWPVSVWPTIGICAADNEIRGDKRAALEQVSLNFVQALADSNVEAAYTALSPEAKQAVPRDKLAALVASTIRPLAPFSDVRVVQIYLLNVITSASNARTICGSPASPEGWVSVAVRSGAEQAHVLVDAQTKNNGWTFTLSLASEQNWRVNYFHLAPSSLAGKTARDMWDLARSEQQSKRNFNAAILYQTASQLAYRGPNFQLGISSEIQKEALKLQLPPELQGQPPFVWKFGGDEYKIRSVGPIGVGGKIYLMVTQETAPWSADQEADQRNRTLIADFKRAIPEYSSAFAGLVVSAKESGGNRIFRTVDDMVAAPK